MEISEPWTRSDVEEVKALLFINAVCSRAMLQQMKTDHALDAHDIGECAESVSAWRDRLVAERLGLI